jgi:hypothetical protein
MGKVAIGDIADKTAGNLGLGGGEDVEHTATSTIFP